MKFSAVKIGPHVVLPILILAVAGAGAWAMVHFKTKVETKPPEVAAPLVRTMVVHERDLRIDVHSQGEVRAATISDLTAEVSGKVDTVASSLVAGGFFKANQEILVQLKKDDYLVAKASAEAAVAQATVALQREEAEADIARREWKSMGKGKASPLTLREPQVKEAKARLAAAEANLKKAVLDLARTSVKAPFDGRVQSKNVDVGMFVNRGTPLARIYSTHAFEIRLPLHDSELRFLNLPAEGQPDPTGKDDVTLSVVFGGKTYAWKAKVVRTEGALDAKTRQVHVVARVEDPYGHNKKGKGKTDRPPLALGLYVRAALDGKLFHNIVRIPRDALRGQDKVLVVDDEARLHYRKVEILRAGMQYAFVSKGLHDGETICISPLTTAVDGMQVRKADADGMVPPGGNGESK